jgi:hypothetical protein
MRDFTLSRDELEAGTAKHRVEVIPAEPNFRPRPAAPVYEDTTAGRIAAYAAQANRIDPILAAKAAVIFSEQQGQLDELAEHLNQLLVLVGELAGVSPSQS